MPGMTFRLALLTAVAAAALTTALSGCGGQSAVSADGNDELPTSQTAAAESGTNAAAERKDEPGEDWPQFLGPRGTGVSGETGLLDKWPENGPPVLWERTIGTGYSAPSVRGDRVVVHHRLGRKEIVECLQPSDGETLWKYDYRTDYADPYGYNNGPRCSPLLTEDRCYTYGAEGKLVCVELATGKHVWTRDVQADWKLPQWFFGIGCSPVLEGNLIIALVGGQPNSGVVAFDKDTGKTVWEAVGKETWDGAKTTWRNKPVYEWTGDEQVVSYSSPIVATIHGKRHFLMVGRQGLVSLDPQTGNTNFKHWFASTSFESVNAARPVVVGNRIFLSSAYKVGSVLLDVHEDGKDCDVVWQDSENMLTHWSTAIHVDGFVYGFSGRHEKEGELRCVDLKTGEVQWQATGYSGDLSALEQDPKTGGVIVRGANGKAHSPWYGRGSKIQIGDRFIVLGEQGTLALVKIDPEKFEELARASYDSITGPSWTGPVLSRKRLYLRDEDTVLCLDLAPRMSKSGDGR